MEDYEKKAELNFIKGRYGQKKLMVHRRRIPLRRELLKDDEAKKYIISINQLIYFYRNFETRVPIKKGEVYLAKFGYECGNELTGNHYVVAILDSNAISQIVTVVPLTSEKGQPINPASSLYIGEIEGLADGSKGSIALINQVRTIDKRRLFDTPAVANLYRLMRSEYDYACPEITVEIKKVYRLTHKVTEKIRKAVDQYLYNGYIKHTED